MSSQQHADLALSQWQALRALAPEDRMEALVASLFLPPAETDLEFDLTLERVAAEMERA